jgi:1,4-alpha-glucan branching enzyme
MARTAFAALAVAAGRLLPDLSAVVAGLERRWARRSAGDRCAVEYLSWLGVGAVWLSPIHPSPMADFGYDVADFTGVDPVFGTEGELERMIAGTEAES